MKKEKREYSSFQILKKYSTGLFFSFLSYKKTVFTFFFRAIQIFTEKSKKNVKKSLRLHYITYLLSFLFPLSFPSSFLLLLLFLHFKETEHTLHILKSNTHTHIKQKITKREKININRAYTFFSPSSLILISKANNNTTKKGLQSFLFSLLFFLLKKFSYTYIHTYLYIYIQTEKKSIHIIHSFNHSFSHPYNHSFIQSFIIIIKTTTTNK